MHAEDPPASPNGHVRPSDDEPTRRQSIWDVSSSRPLDERMTGLGGAGNDRPPTGYDQPEQGDEPAFIPGAAPPTAPAGPAGGPWPVHPAHAPGLVPPVAPEQVAGLGRGTASSAAPPAPPLGFVALPGPYAAGQVTGAFAPVQPGQVTGAFAPVPAGTSAAGILVSHQPTGGALVPVLGPPPPPHAPTGTPVGGSLPRGLLAAVVTLLVALLVVVLLVVASTVGSTDDSPEPATAAVPTAAPAASAAPAADEGVRAGAEARSRRRERSRDLRRERSQVLAALPPTSRTRCDAVVSIGPNTTCPFAENVRRAAEQTTTPGRTLRVRSPVTRRTYAVRCLGGAPNVCVGGDDATVFLR